MINQTKRMKLIINCYLLNFLLRDPTILIFVHPAKNDRLINSN